ncbi:DEAD/DEAH box helicase [Acidimicrobiia bacterium EGI L10123]|uniref:DEAD/DEAH box helicase n=1 Tax=Salinilacustrithrix flava TaxID=2957203 RepID=UPI003D7C1949|nr:DEAD/DEAH box helicase [Acidimicrobiia bacterium EGI L10123]
MRLAPTTEATFVAGLHGRDGALALWDLDPADTDDAIERKGEVTVVLADGPRTVPADLVAVGDAVATLAALPAAAEVRPSVRAWSVATRLALDAVSRGRLLPAVAGDGADMWRLGPLDVADRTRVDQLADALPPAAHATPVEVDGAPPRLTSPNVATAGFLDAVADSFVRTAAAAATVGFDAFAAPHATDVTGAESWLQSTVAGTASDTAPGLRIALPDGPDEPVRCVLQVQSRLDPSLVLDAAELWQAPAAVVARFGTDVETDLLLALRAAARVWPPVERLLQEAAPEVLVLEDAEAEELFGPVADDLAAAGLPVLWPAEVLRPVELRPIIGTPAPEGGGGGAGLDLSALGEMRWHATVDGGDLTEAELLQLAEAKRPVVRLRGQWVRADPERLRRLAERTPISTGDVLSAALSGTVTVGGETVEAEVDAPLRNLADRLRSIDTIRAHPAPPDLVATLRPYQERGLAWLQEMASLGLGGVLADDMGLGKTIQVLALHLLRRGSGPTLIVCPASLLGNWQREAARFCPDVPVRRYHGADRSLEGLADDELVVATYGIVRRDAEVLAEQPWDLLVADEAQAVKNPMSRTARQIRTIPAAARFALTGTPVENRLSDLWALLDFTTPGLLGKLDAFQQHVATPIERERDAEATARLASLVRPFLLRRRKTDPEIAPDLPPKTETDRFVGLTTEQATLYKAVVTELLDDVAEAEGINRRGLVLKLLTALKQICNHPAQYLGQDAPISGRSGKLEAVTDLVETIASEGDSVLVFTQYVRMGHLLTRHLTALDLEVQFLHGGTPVNGREAMVDRFQAGGPMVFVISLQAGGTGLNLTRATHVVHYDRWWNPAVEDQASDRAWRIGQDRPVQVHRMICEGTLEERIATLLEAKRGLAESVVGGGESWVSELSDDELADLVELGGGVDLGRFDR